MADLSLDKVMLQDIAGKIGRRIATPLICGGVTQSS